MFNDKFDRKTHWQHIYQDKKALEVSWYQETPELSLTLINDAQIASNEPIIDVGGGASVLVDHLIDRGFTNLAVLDISGNALLSAKNRLGESAKHIDWFEADITEFSAPHRFSLWHDRAVFHFLTDPSDRKRYIRTLKKSLRPGGHLIIAAFSIGGPDKCSGLEIVQYNAEKLLAELGDGFDLREERHEIHLTPTNKQQKFGYFRFIKNV